MDKIEVTQADRDAAASLMSDVGLFSNVLTAKAVQAFARHRTNRPPATDVAALVEALGPFITHNSSEEYTTIKVRSSAIARARKALAPFTGAQ